MTDPLCWKTRTSPEVFEGVSAVSLYTLCTLIAMQGVFPFLKKTALFPLRGRRGEQTKKQKFWRLLLKAIVNKDLGYRKNGDKKEKLVV